MTELLSVSNLSVKYAPDAPSAVDGVSIDIPSVGYTLAVVGESGSGKSTLGMCFMNLVEPPGRIVSGKIEYMGKDILSMGGEDLRRFRWQEVALVPQSAMNSFSPVKKVSDHVTQVLRERARLPKSEAKAKSLELLAEVGIKTERANAYSHELSGGMRQRACIATALSLSPKLLIADEPTSALDVVVQQQILELLRKRVVKAGLSLFFITHEIAILENLVENVCVMFSGEIVERGPLGKILFEPLHPYTQMLLESMPTLESRRDALSRFSRTKESMSIPRTGCKFANRCKYAFDRCRTEAPLLKETDHGRLVSCHKVNP